MPRQLIIGTLIVLILGILGGTIVVVIQRLRPETAVTDPAAIGNGDLPDATSGRQQLGDKADSDSDGLPDAEERLWGTDIRNADSDGDGFLDGQEVAARHNPTIAGPNDALPANFQLPGASVSPTTSPSTLTLSDVQDPSDEPITLTTTPLNPDQYLQEGLDVNAPRPNLTQVYQAQGGNTADTVHMLAFVKSQPLLTALPAIPVAQENIIPPGDRELLETYLEGILSPALYDGQTLHGALSNLFQGNISSLRLTLTSLRNHQQNMRTQRIPAEAFNLHRMVLGYNEAVIAALQRVSQYATDPVGALVAIRELDAMDRQYYSLILSEIQRLD